MKAITQFVAMAVLLTGVQRATAQDPPRADRDPMQERVFNALDADGDGVISQEEFGERAPKLYRHLEGRRPKAEERPAPPEARRPPREPRRPMAEGRPGPDPEAMERHISELVERRVNEIIDRRLPEMVRDIVRDELAARRRQEMPRRPGAGPRDRQRGWGRGFGRPDWAPGLREDLLPPGQQGGGYWQWRGRLDPRDIEEFMDHMSRLRRNLHGRGLWDDNNWRNDLLDERPEWMPRERPGDDERGDRREGDEPRDRDVPREGGR